MGGWIDGWGGGGGGGVFEVVDSLVRETVWTSGVRIRAMGKEVEGNRFRESYTHPTHPLKRISSKRTNSFDKGHEIKFHALLQILIFILVVINFITIFQSTSFSMLSLQVSNVIVINNEIISLWIKHYYHCYLLFISCYNFEYLSNDLL